MKSIQIATLVLVTQLLLLIVGIVVFWTIVG